MGRARLKTAAAGVLLLLTTCTASDDCAAGNPLMPHCLDRASEPRLVFISNRHEPLRDDRLDVYSMTSAGTEIRRLTVGKRADVARWSPDGSRIAYGEVALDFPVTPRASLVVIDADGGNPRELTGPGNTVNAYPAWSPDGRRIAFHSNRHAPAVLARTSIYVMNSDGTGIVRLTRNDAWNDRSPHWSPDGSKIAFMSNRVGGVMQIFVMNADGSDPRQLTTVGINLWPQWSPDGTKISFASWRRTDGVPDNGLFMMNADGSGETRLTTSGSMIDMFSTWAPDGREIYFCSSRSGMNIWKVRLEDRVVRAVTNPGGMSMEAMPNARWPAAFAAAGR